MSQASDPHPPTADEPFEAMLDRLREVVEALEQGELPLEESLARFEEGVRLSRQAASKLAAAERRIEALVEEGGALKLVPFATGESDESGGTK